MAKTEAQEASAKAWENVDKAENAEGVVPAPEAGTMDYPPQGKDGNPAATPAPATPAPESEWEQLANAQAAQYLAATNNLAPLTSGTGISNIDSQMASGAEAMLGQSGGGQMAAWLNQQGAAAKAQYAPVQAAVGQEETAEQSAEKLEASGIQNMGQAETAQLAEAPYQQLLTALASDVPYKLLGNYGNFNLQGITGNTVDPGLGLALKNLNVDTAGVTTDAPALPPVGTAATTAAPPSSATTQSGGNPVTGG